MNFNNVFLEAKFPDNVDSMLNHCRMMEIIETCCLIPLIQYYNRKLQFDTYLFEDSQSQSRIQYDKENPDPVHEFDRPYWHPDRDAMVILTDEYLRLLRKFRTDDTIIHHLSI